MAFQHGVYIQELDTKILGVRTCDSALPFIVGAAPVQSLSGDKPVNISKLIFNYKEFIATFGDVPAGHNEADYSLSAFARIYFTLYGMSPVVFVNVFDPAVHKTAVSAEAKTFTTDKITLANPGVANEVVKNTDGTVTYVKDTDYTIDYAKGEITRLATGQITAGQSVKVDYNWADVSKVYTTEIIGGVDATTNKRTGLELIEEVFSSFGKVLGIVLAPGYSYNSSVANAMIAKAEKVSDHFKAQAYIDVPPTVEKPADALTFKATFGSPHAVICWPQIKYGDQTHWLSAHAAGLTAKVDEKNTGVPYESPSNKELRIDSPAKILTIQEANYLNEQGIVTVFRFSTGWKLWGNRTAAFPEVTDIKDSFIPCRRMANWIENNLVLLTWQKVDDPMNKRLIETVVSTENIWLNGLVGRSFLIGAKVYFRKEDNPLTDLANGIIRFYITYLAPPPAETIEYILEVDVTYFNNLFGGG
ncbi:MAG: phage tail sheath subtilisin-like domain-containing protein [Nitrospirae bacterium]|nr:phage tail sheath subtilisin-like domain-containing protein [Nitrospirota bacterium]